MGIISSLSALLQTSQVTTQSTGNTQSSGMQPPDFGAAFILNISRQNSANGAQDNVSFSSYSPGGGGTCGPSSGGENNLAGAFDQLLASIGGASSGSGGAASPGDTSGSATGATS